MSSTSTGPRSSLPSSAIDYVIRRYTPPYDSWPYSPLDFARQDESVDTRFYAPPRFVTHIDDNAIACLRRYYAASLPQKGRLLELCSSWVSHLPPHLEAAAERTARVPNAGSIHGHEVTGGGSAVSRSPGGHPGRTSVVDGSGDGDGDEVGAADPDRNATGDRQPSLFVTGYGMNAAELEANPVLSRRIVKDLNASPDLDGEDKQTPDAYDAAVCVVSIDYLTKPREVLTAAYAALKPGASIHLAISNRCFPTKAVARWLNVSEQQRLDMVADYLWFSGFRDIEIMSIVRDDNADAVPRPGLNLAAWFVSQNDPLWIVRGKKPTK